MNTIRVQRANVILDIRPEEKERYKEMGYNVIDEKSGAVVEAALSNDVNVLRRELKEARETIEAQAKEIARLKKKSVKE